MRRLLSILNFVQSDGDLSVEGSNSRTFGPLGTPMSIRGVLGAGGAEDEDDDEEGSLRIRSDGRFS